MSLTAQTEPETQRAHARTSMFVLASMTSATASGPVKIRNMSSSGALIEGGSLPVVGDHLSIRRGDLAAAGRIVWRLEGRAGVRFDCEVDVSNWLPTGFSGRQQQVDQTFSELKAGLATDKPAASQSPAPASRIAPSRIERLDLLETADALDVLADLLAEDVEVVVRLSARLQALDIASQLLRRCAGAMPVQAAPGQRTFPR
jgi:hypothetical protein